jgi:hypothetical protein
MTKYDNQYIQQTANISFVALMKNEFKIDSD